MERPACRALNFRFPTQADLHVPAIEPDQGQRKKLVWEIDHRVQKDATRQMIYHYRLGTCHHPWVHGITVMVDSIFNGWRFEDAWLDR